MGKTIQMKNISLTFRILEEPCSMKDWYQETLLFASRMSLGDWQLKLSITLLPNAILC